MGIGPSLQAFEEVFPTLPYDSFTPSGNRRAVYNIYSHTHEEVSRFIYVHLSHTLAEGEHLQFTWPAAFSN